MPDESIHLVTLLLARMRDGDRDAAEELLPLVYSELHGIATCQMHGQAAGHTLQTTALVNEVFLRMFDGDGSDWENRAHFFSVASRAMRSILVDHARGKNRLKRKPAGERVTLDGLIEGYEERAIDLEQLDRALLDLEQHDERMVRLVELRFFGGRGMAETAETLGMSLRMAEREWRTARAWLRKELE
jgi:RNA polymerase sigma-70 factor (ECF subfamily)